MCKTSLLTRSLHSSTEKKSTRTLKINQDSARNIFRCEMTQPWEQKLKYIRRNHQNYINGIITTKVALSISFYKCS
ncbi:hypothetical protein E2C01_018197 [Portunus trituberculatus]|uniref:Uncharacterized protein n=1 Tax=Portunus trituberculatus TaxID=210409 RepID=A0A5B7DVI3_PORTR|nr:hypothetical protein [Portunus trituberculatus]